MSAAVYKRPLLICATTAVAVLCGYALHAIAEGAPTTAPLFYAGTLEANGQLASGPHTITLKLYDAEAAGNELCTSETPNAPVEGGRFRVEVSETCVGKMKANPDVWVDLTFTNAGTGDTKRLPTRTKVGAVPYALEAQHAVSATTVGSLGEADLQRRIGGACPVGQAVRAVAIDGTVQCEPDDDTLYTGRNGVAIAGTSVAADTTYVQRRVSGNCGAGAFIQSIGADGSVSCGNRAARVEVVAIMVNLNNPADGWYTRCMSNPSDGIACALAANRDCVSRGFAGGWFVGESSDNVSRLVNCLR